MWPAAVLCLGRQSKMSASWTAYVVGPFAALLPKRWRQGERNGPTTYFARAALISGVAEAVLSLMVMGFWYAGVVGLFSSHYANFITTSAQALSSEWTFAGGAGLIGFATNPITWLILYFAFEGVIRAFAAIASNEVVGTLPLYLADFLWRKLRRKRKAPELPLVPDEITPGGSTCDIRIASCRRRDGWRYPFTLRYAGGYFQVIDEQYMAAGPRPYIYSLRRLPPGEIARGLKNYDPADVLTPIHRIQPL